MIADLDELADASGGRFAGAKRLAWTQDWRDARAWLTGKLDALGAPHRVDPAGNLWAGTGPIAVGSHLDAVPDGGWLDGALGVCAELEALRHHPGDVRLVDWADEEGARFGRSVVGSSAAAGTLDVDELRTLTDKDGVTFAQALAENGITSMDARNELRDIAAYLELHIEQGPVLLDAGRLCAAVNGTVGCERFLVTFTGQSAHAGSTPMRSRKDSFAAAARAALDIRDIAMAHDGLATVGGADAQPNVVTAVAGTTEMKLDLRHLDAATLATMRAEALSACEDAARQHGCTVEARQIFRAAPSLFDPELVAIARRHTDGGAPIPSGPLHDATEIARVVPTVMVFAQSDPPLSHTRIEDSPAAALAAAITAFGQVVGEVVRTRASRPA